MQLVSLQDRVSFVNSLDISRGQIEMLATDQPTAKVDAGSLVSFAANISDGHRSDALNATLLAQLAADKLHSRFDSDQLMGWYKKYVEVLGNVGWSMQSFQFQDYSASGSTFSIDSAITDIVSSFLPAGEVAIVRATLNALSNLGNNDPWYQVWDRSSHTANGGNFQLASCTDNNGEANTLVMKMSAYAFSTTDTTTRFLWTNYNSSSTDLHFASQSATLNEDVYAGVRQTVIDKLGALASTYIGSLDI